MFKSSPKKPQNLLLTKTRARKKTYILIVKIFLLMMAITCKRISLSGKILRCCSQGLFNVSSNSHLDLPFLYFDFILYVLELGGDKIESLFCRYGRRRYHAQI